uniref:MADF domain-containing protein n=1 Tax=Ditylenchus dipsaci TaxID=166011 RepID=A0A915EHZ8_9BILA
MNGTREKSVGEISTIFDEFLETYDSKANSPKKQKTMRFYYTPYEEQKMWNYFVQQLKAKADCVKAKTYVKLWEQCKRVWDVNKTATGMESHFRKKMLPNIWTQRKLVSTEDFFRIIRFFKFKPTAKQIKILESNFTYQVILDDEGCFKNTMLRDPAETQRLQYEALINRKVLLTSDSDSEECEEFLIDKHNTHLLNNAPKWERKRRGRPFRRPTAESAVQCLSSTNPAINLDIMTSKIANQMVMEKCRAIGKPKLANELNGEPSKHILEGSVALDNLAIKTRAHCSKKQIRTEEQSKFQGNLPKERTMNNGQGTERDRVIDQRENTFEQQAETSADDKMTGLKEQVLRKVLGIWNCDFYEKKDFLNDFPKIQDLDTNLAAKQLEWILRDDKLYC